MGEQTVTLADFQAVQEQVIQLKTENIELKDQIEAAKRRSTMSGQQICEALKNDNLQLRVTINQVMKERDVILEKLKRVSIIQFLQHQNLTEASKIPDIQSMPQQVQPIANEVLALMEDVKGQIHRRAFLDTQVNELSKKTKSLGRIGEQLQAQINELREKQKAEMAALDSSRNILQNLEVETTRLRDSISAATTPRQSQLTQEDLKVLIKKTTNLEETIQTKKTEHQRIVDELTAKIEEYNRNIEDSNAAKAVINKKLQQKISTIQNEINKRRGIVVQSTKSGSRADSANLFMKSKQLIDSIAKMQESNWELEERVAFSRNSLKIMANEIVKNKFGKVTDSKNNEMYTKSHQMILRIAEIDRILNETKTK